MNEQGISKKRYLLVAGIVIIAALILVSIVHSWSGQKNNNQPSSASLKPQPATAVIEITRQGFVPKTIAINPNTEVVWLNEDVMPHLPAADPYPDHSSMPNLIAPRALGQKETYSFLFTQKRTVNYHDQINPTLTGEIEVR